jgi:transcriptional regulator with XRE-family HTH domain
MKCPHCLGLGTIQTDKMTVGDLIAAARVKSGLSQYQLAEALGTGRAHVAAVENGNRDIPSNMLRRYAQHLNIDIMELIP